MGMSKRACQGGRTNSGELLSSPPMVTPLLTFCTACLAGIQAIPTLPLFARLRPGFFRAFPHADVSPAAESALAPRPGALSQRTES